MTRISEAELEQLVEAIGGSLVLFARQWCSSPDDALQEALLELATRDPAPRSPKAWLFRVVRNKAMNLARAERRRSKHEAAFTVPSPWFEPDSGSFIDAQLATSWLQQLPDVQRQIVTARIWADLTFEQIAEVVDRPTATVFRLFREAIETLRQQMKPPVEKQTTPERKLENRR
ncbi:MAG: sigma-70 family RNA polymerase sigma factor [Planctomycetes bacterium]|nr:sigma-70 family RNA polymerase sigma factor [Planctomycetota bacterium]